MDIIGFDIYQRNNGAAATAYLVKDVGEMLGTLENIAAEKHKIPTLTEYGYGRVPGSTWWTSTFLKAQGNHKVSFVLGWRNAG